VETEADKVAVEPERVEIPRPVPLLYFQFWGPVAVLIALAFVAYITGRLLGYW
jgi:hypothetical protein